MKITVKNHLNQTLVLNSLELQVVKVDGLTPSHATINTFGAGITDGTFYNSSYANPRNIVLTLVPEGNVEAVRLMLYRYFKPKYPVRLYFETGSRNVFIDGFVETFEGSLYSLKQSFQISVLCPQPFFNDVNAVVINQTYAINDFSFPFFTTESGIVLSHLELGNRVNIDNAGEESTGIIIQMLATSNVVEPTFYNVTTRETFTFRLELLEGDLVEIDTRRGKKTITRIRNGIRTNEINSIVRGSDWFNVPMGENIFTYTCAYGSENLKVTYTLYPLYGGV